MAAPARCLPKLVAFDLDGTLWYPEMYMLRIGAPFRADSSGAVYDAGGERMRLLGDTLRICAQIAHDPAWRGVQVAYVSRTEYPEWALPCLQMFQVPQHPLGGDDSNGGSMASQRGNGGSSGGSPLTLFDLGHHKEIYPGSKRRHFAAIQRRSGIPYDQMLFFDNERWNITDVAPLGVVGVYTPRGLTAAVWEAGLAKFAGTGSAQPKAPDCKRGSS